MPPLRRTVALEQVHHAAVVVGEDLHLDVARVGDEPLDVERAVAERRGRFAARRLDRLVDLAGVVDVAHALAAAAGGRLDQRRQADAIDRLTNAAVGLILRRLARHDGTPAACTRRRASIFDPICAMTSAGGPTNVSPAPAQAAANAAFSERNP